MAEIVLVVLAGLSVVATRLVYRRQWFNPLVAFVFLYVFLFALYRVGAHVGDFPEISSRADALYTMAFVMFFMGSATVMMATRETVKHAESKGQQIVEWNERRCRAFYNLVKLLAVAWILGVGYKFWLVVQAYGNPFEMLAVIRQDLATREFSFPLVISYTTLIGNLTILNLGVLFVYGKSKRGVVALIGVSLAVMMLDALTTGNRGGFRLFVMLVCAILATYVIRKKRVHWKHLAMASIAAAAFLMVLSVAVLVRTRWQATVVEGVVVSSIYTNIAANVPAFSYFIEHPPEKVLPGYYVFRGVYVFLDTLLDDFFGKPFLPAFAYDPFNVELYADLGSGEILHNTANDMTYVYWEGGALGLSMYMYLLGAIASYVFVRAVKRKRVVDAQLLAIVMTALVMNARGIFFSAIGFWLTVAMVGFQHVIFGGLHAPRQNAMTKSRGTPEAA